MTKPLLAVANTILYETSGMVSVSTDRGFKKAGFNHVAPVEGSKTSNWGRCNRAGQNLKVLFI